MNQILPAPNFLHKCLFLFRALLHLVSSTDDSDPGGLAGQADHSHLKTHAAEFKPVSSHLDTGFHIFKQ